MTIVRLENGWASGSGVWAIQIRGREIELIHLHIAGPLVTYVAPEQVGEYMARILSGFEETAAPEIVRAIFPPADEGAWGRLQEMAEWAT